MNAGRVFVSGSIAYDTILDTDAALGVQRHQAAAITVCAHTMRREYGGCAANIAYGLAQLGTRAVVDAAVGRDFAPYARHLKRAGITLEHVVEIPDAWTAQAFIVSGADGEQVTALHPGAMASGAERAMPALEHDIAVGILAPDDPRATRGRARALEGRASTLIFDPGQGIGNFSGEALSGLCAKADAVIVNRGEWTALAERTGERERALAAKVGKAVITQGEAGARLIEHGEERTIGAAPAGRARDPTGCGDALRAGLVHALAQGAAWGEAVRLGCVVAAEKIAHPGAQGYELTAHAVRTAYRRAYGARCPVPVGPCAR